MVLGRCVWMCVCQFIHYILRLICRAIGISLINKELIFFFLSCLLVAGSLVIYFRSKETKKISLDLACLLHRER